MTEEVTAEARPNLTRALRPYRDTSRACKFYEQSESAPVIGIARVMREATVPTPRDV